MQITILEIPQTSQSQRIGSVDALDLLVDSCLTLIHILTWRQLMTTNQRMSQHEVHLSILDKYGDADFCMCKTCRPETRNCSPWIICRYDDPDNCLCTAIELVRANHSNSDGINDDVAD